MKNRRPWWLVFCLSIVLLMSPLGGITGEGSCDHEAMTTISSDSGQAMADDCEGGSGPCDCAIDAGCQGKMPHSPVALIVKTAVVSALPQARHRSGYYRIYRALLPSPESPPPIL